MKNISEEVKKSLIKLGYEKATPIQEKVIPLLLEGKDVIAKSKTGSGKTCAYALPICESVVWETRHVQAIVLACTRELAMQIKEECALIGKYKKVKVQCVVGKENVENQKALLKQGCHVLVATPGRLLDLMEQGCIHIEEVKTLIVDEADYMMDLGFIEDVEKIVSYLPSNIQKAFFSATYPEKIQTLLKTHLPNAQYIEIEEEVQIDHYYSICDTPLEKIKELLLTLDIESTLIFCETRKDVEEVFQYLKKNRIPCARIHGELKQQTRFDELLRFKNGEVRVLVASDVASRGLDIQKVSHVFHYGNVNHKETYIHRSGRSGRIKEKGNSILLVEEINEFYDSLIEEFHSKDICEYICEKENKIFEKVEKKNKTDLFKDEIEKIYISAGSEKKIGSRDIIGALCSLEGIDKEDIGIIEVLRKMSYVEIYHHKAKMVVEQMKDKTIKKKKVKVELAK